ncbi:hypothetical protein ACIRPQ_09345 [Streptomyces sp. NPDC101213]|uniref:hypothetical protein n=1 Tax=Streptomyces sp. NPDC101213 TaxID=3366130 RepID=UPI0038043E1E
MPTVDSEAPLPGENQPFQDRAMDPDTVAGILHDLAALDGRNPQELAAERVAGSLVIPEGTVGDAIDDWGLFDGPPHLASRVREHLRGGEAL